MKGMILGVICAIGISVAISTAGCLLICFFTELWERKNRR